MRSLTPQVGSDQFVVSVLFSVWWPPSHPVLKNLACHSTVFLAFQSVLEWGGGGGFTHTRNLPISHSALYYFLRVRDALDASVLPVVKAPGVISSG